ncbi:MAG: RNA polymerase Rpb4 [Conexivisphaerales archaeon]
MVEELERKPLTIHEAKKLLEKVDAEKADQIQKRTLDYVTKFSNIDGDDSRAMVKELMKETGLTEQEAVEVVNIMPKTREELRTFTVGWRKLVATDVLDKILSILNSKRPKTSS